MRAKVLAAHDTDPHRVAAACAGPVPGAKAHWYMKHMAHHMIDGVPLDWARDCVNIHLIRHPARVIASYGEKWGEMTLDDIGYPQQLRLWRALPGPVVNSADIRRDPGRALGGLCAALGLPFVPDMLRWPAGPRAFDGVWAAHWYGAVHRSTGFAGAEGPLPEVPPHRQALLQAVLPIYQAMRAEALPIP